MDIASDPSPQVRRILSNPRHTLAVGERLLELDRTRKCDYNDETIQDIHHGVQKIAHTVLKGIQKLDSRFEGELFGIGSFYDGLKVGVVDEFDFLLQLKASYNDLVLLKSEPGFAHVMVPDYKSPKWPTHSYCLEHNCIEPTEMDWDYIDLFDGDSMTCDEAVEVMNPEAVQERFRELSDKVLKDMSLPDNWVHGGFNRPAFSGFRKHGPATLYQFVWTSPDHSKEIKVNLDLTMAISIPTSVSTEKFQFDFQKRFASSNWAVADLQAMIDGDPGLSIIPLYSNFLIATGKGDKKYSWKVSCSRIEQQFLEHFPDDSLLKTLIRTLKIIRDDHLTYYKRKTQRQKRRRKKKPPTRPSTRTTSSFDWETSSRQEIDCVDTRQKATTEPVNTDDTIKSTEVSSQLQPFLDCAQELMWIDDRMKKLRLQVSEVMKGIFQPFASEQCGNNDVNGEETNDVAIVTLENAAQSHDSNDATLGNCTKSHDSKKTQIEGKHDVQVETDKQQYEDERRPLDLTIQVAGNPLVPKLEHQLTTDMTEIEELSAVEYQRKYESQHSKYQTYDIGRERVMPEPGSGEYYGARQYVASIEIKFMAMSFALSERFFPEVFRRKAQPEDLAKYVLLSLDHFKHMYGDGLNLRSLYYPSAVCSPLSADKRSKVTKQIAKIIDSLAKDERM